MAKDNNSPDAHSGADQHHDDCEYMDLRERKFDNKAFGETPIGAKEWQAIETRRAAIRDRPPGEFVTDKRDRVGDRNVTGLAFSGGGIRSAAFNLGALQAFHTFSGIEGIDYLSTVSGGGYIGCCLTTALAATKPSPEQPKKGPPAQPEENGQFPFTSKNPRLFDDTPAVRHIRDYSNFLMPRGATDLIGSIGIILRGLLVNMLIIAPFLFLAVSLTLFLYPVVYPNGVWITSSLVAVYIVSLILWGLWSRFRPGLFASAAGGKQKSYGFLVSVSKWLFFITLIGVAFDLQMTILHWAISNQAPAQEAASVDSWLSWLPANLAGKLSVLVASSGAILAYFAKNLTQVAAAAARSPTWLAWTKKVAAKAGLWFAALTIPVLLWLFYLWLTFQGLRYEESDPASWPIRLSPVLFYFSAFVLATVLALFTDPNATSLHRLYKERLSKAFLFDPDARYLFDPDTHLRKKYADLRELLPAISKIDTKFCPYPIVNASLNLEGSRFANRRGRDADFFVFTPEYIGSDATGYVRSKTIEERTGVDLGAAMAISGAAVSPNMGSATIGPLVFTLAFLNIRLGYWLYNPLNFQQASRQAKRDNPLVEIGRKAMDLAPIRLIREMFSLIDETSRTIYLTDGGNLENLGLHELLRRRCKLIVVVDAEQDPTMSFPSLLTLERYARIDFGGLIDLPWEAVAAHCQAISAAFKKSKEDGSPVPSTPGPHCAVGEILYGGGPDDRGVLVYVKSSLSGDEDDYLLDYKRRNPAFPHESTGDQFFVEEQFEAYRALGFHILKGLFTKGTPFSVRPRQGESKEAARKRLREEIMGYLKSPRQAVDCD